MQQQTHGGERNAKRHQHDERRAHTKSCIEKQMVHVLAVSSKR